MRLEVDGLRSFKEITACEVAGLSFPGYFEERVGCRVLEAVPVVASRFMESSFAASKYANDI